MNFSDSFFKKVEKKTNVGKDTILALASKLQQSDLKNEVIKDKPVIKKKMKLIKV